MDADDSDQDVDDDSNVPFLLAGHNLRKLFMVLLAAVFVLFSFSNCRLLCEQTCLVE